MFILAPVRDTDTKAIVGRNSLRVIGVHFEVGEKKRLTAGLVAAAVGLDSHEYRVNLGQGFGIVALQNPAFSRGVVLIENAQVNGLLPVRPSSTPSLESTCSPEFGLLVQIIGVKNE